MNEANSVLLRRAIKIAKQARVSLEQALVLAELMVAGPAR